MQSCRALARGNGPGSAWVRVLTRHFPCYLRELRAKRLIMASAKDNALSGVTISELAQRNEEWDAKVETLLAAGLGRQRLQTIAASLSVPPLTTCLRVNTHKADPDEVFHDLVRAAQEAGQAQCPFRLDDIPEGILIPGSGPHAIDYSASSGKEIVITRKAGEAVLRGAEVFVPGVLACSPGIAVGDAVIVSIAIEPPGSRSFAMSRGYRLGSDPEIEARCSNRQRLGIGISQLARTEMFRAQHGVAVLMQQRVYRPGAPCCALEPGTTMLQNLPSLVTAAVLQPTPGSRVLDMCAAPGGKTTALAARVAGRQGQRSEMAASKGIVVALDRSHAKAAHIRSLAAECGVTDYVKAFKGDATRCIVVDDAKLCPDDDKSIADTPVSMMSEGLKRRLERKALARQRHKQDPVVSAHLPEGKERVCPGFPPASFDAVLCDAPCSALGLRPRLLHEQGLEELRGTAQYQRKILASGVAALKPGGSLVFSTCTISHLENEANVRWLLDTFPEMKLVPAEPRIGGPGLQGSADGVQLLSAEEASMVQRFDPGIIPEQGLDTIGFFITKFVKAVRNS